MTMESGTSVRAESRFLDDLVAWLNRRLAPDGVVLGPDTELFADGLIDSMRILDATVTRLLLIPSLMVLFGRWNWWPGVRGDDSG